MMTATTAERLRAHLTAARGRGDADAAAGDGRAGPMPRAAILEAEDTAAVTRALADAGPGWLMVWSRVLATEVVFTRAVHVVVPEPYAGLPRFDRAELAVLAAQRLSAERLRAIVDAKREMPGARVVADSGEGLTPARDVFPTTTNATTTKAPNAAQGALRTPAAQRRD